MPGKRLRDWVHAFRPRTLPLAASSIIVGSGLAAFSNGYRPMVLVPALLTAILLQILSNLSNDLGDHLHGTDNAHRVGPRRAVQSGAIPPAAMKRAMIGCGILAFLSGTVLITLALGLSLPALAFLLTGLLAMAAAVKYTFGKNPYGYAGWGDASVLLFFGLVGVGGTYYLHMGSFAAEILPPAFGFGLLAVGVLNTNNMRDISNDAASGKRTMVVRLGGDRAKRYHAALLLCAGVCITAFTVFNFRSWWQFAFLPGFIVIDRHLRVVLRNIDPRALDPEIKRLALGTFLTALTFALGLILA